MRWRRGWYKQLLSPRHLIGINPFASRGSSDCEVSSTSWLEKLISCLSESKSSLKSNLAIVWSLSVKRSCWDTSTSSQVSNCAGVLLEIYLDHKFQWSQDRRKNRIICRSLDSNPHYLHIQEFFCIKFHKNLFSLFFLRTRIGISHYTRELKHATWNMWHAWVCSK